MADLLTSVRPMTATIARPAPVTALKITAYEWRRRNYPWAQRVLAAAETRHGTPPAERPRRAGDRRYRDERCGACGYLLTRCDCPVPS